MNIFNDPDDFHIADAILAVTLPEFREGAMGKVYNIPFKIIKF